jgi:hypothetical protein
VEKLCTKKLISTHLEIIKGLHRKYEDGYTRNSRKPLLQVLNRGQEQRIKVNVIESMQSEEKENPLKFTECVTSI